MRTAYLSQIMDGEVQMLLGWIVLPGSQSRTYTETEESKLER